jgi:D-3-phosphoglycerate dehydrogenase
LKYVVVVADPVNEQGLELLRGTPECEVAYVAGKPDQLAQVLPRAHALLVRSETKVTDAMMEQAPGLRVIGRAGMGVDNIDVAAATRRGIAVMNTPGGNTVSAAEHAIALLLALVRRIPWAADSMRRGEWDRKKFGGSELRGKVLGLVGLGRIGSHVATVARALGMNVLAHDPYLSEARAAEIGVTLSGLDELLSRADVVSLHLPATEETRNLIDRRRLALLKKSAVLINTARGGVVDEAALVEAVDGGALAGAALDVFEQEPLSKDSPLRKSDRIIVTPHLAASTTEAQERVSIEICHSVREALLTGVIGDAVNIPGLSASVGQRLRPVLDLGRALGRLAGSVSQGRIESIDVEYGGGDEDAPRPSTVAVIEGVLHAIGVEQVSMVNASTVADERGIKVSRGVSKPKKGFETTLDVKVRTDRRTTRVAGAIFGDRIGRVTLIDGFAVDLPPEGYIIVLKNRDVPGVIGRVGTAIGEAKVNIGSYHVARRDHEALATIAVDQPPDGRLLQTLERLPDVLEVRLAKLTG